MKELWDTYGEDEQYRLISEVIVKHRDGTYLFVQRDWVKSQYPGYFELGAGGAALKGEKAMAAAIRELKEETGIDAEGDEENMFPLYSYRTKDTIYQGYLYITNCEKWGLIVQDGETIAYQWFRREKALAMLQSDSFVPSLRERILPYWEQIENMF